MPSQSSVLFARWSRYAFLMFDDLNDLYQQVILDHCKKPRNFHEMPQASCSAQGHNPLCGDQLKLFLALDGDTITDVSFTGSGCCISKASASLLTEFAKGEDIQILRTENGKQVPYRFNFKRFSEGKDIRRSIPFVFAIEALGSSRLAPTPVLKAQTRTRERRIISTCFAAESR